MKSLYKACYGLGFFLAILGAILGWPILLFAGVVLLVVPGFLHVPRRVYVHLTTEDVVHIDAIIEDYMSGFIEIEAVVQELQKIIDAHKDN